MACQINTVLQTRSDWIGCQCFPRTCNAAEGTLIIKGGRGRGGGISVTVRFLLKHQREPYNALCHSQPHSRMQPLACVFSSCLEKAEGARGVSFTALVCWDAEELRQWLMRKGEGETAFKLKFCLTLVLNFLVFCHEVIKWSMILRYCFLFTLFFPQEVCLHK